MVHLKQAPPVLTHDGNMLHDAWVLSSFIFKKVRDERALMFLNRLHEIVVNGEGRDALMALETELAPFDVPEEA